MANKKAYDETNLYREGTVLGQNLFAYIRIMEKNIRKNYGDKMLKDFGTFIYEMRCTYETQDTNQKIEHCIAMENSVKSIETYIKFIRNCKFNANSDFKIASQIIYSLGLILRQIHGWSNKINSKMNE